jgi:hypothetical protein
MNRLGDFLDLIYTAAATQAVSLAGHWLAWPWRYSTVPILSELVDTDLTENPNPARAASVRAGTALALDLLKLGGAVNGPGSPRRLSHQCGMGWRGPVRTSHSARRRGRAANGQ